MVVTSGQRLVRLKYNAKHSSTDGLDNAPVNHICEKIWAVGPLRVGRT